jgi:hypothetical protein
MTGASCTSAERRSAAIVCAVVVALMGITPGSADAQDATASPGLQIQLTPYFWAPYVKARVDTQIPQVPTVEEKVTFGQLFTHLSPVPFMGSAELRYGPYGAVVDYMHFPLRTSIATDNVFFSGGRGDLVEDIATVLFLYRPLAQPRQYLDAGIGVRPWGIQTSISLNSGLLPGRSVSTGAAWADPLIALRYHFEVGSGFGFTAYGDFGGFGLAAHTDWQVYGTIDYVVTRRIDVHLGYRSLNVNYSTNTHDVGFDVNMNGPIIGATFHF